MRAADTDIHHYLSVHQVIKVGAGHGDEATYADPGHPILVSSSNSLRPQAASQQ